MSHAVIPPSSAHVWGKPDGCTGSVLFAQAFPDPGRPEADEGTLAHKFAQYMIEELLAGGTIDSWRDGYVGRVIDNICVSDIMFDSAKVYADDVNRILKKTSPNRVTGLEQKIRATRIHPTHSFGTVDYFLYDPITATLYVWDFKFGRVIREAFESWQMINYTAGILDFLQIHDLPVTVYMKLVQPRAYHRGGSIRTWKTSNFDLIPYFETLERNAAIALSNQATVKSGSHCKYCPGRHACKAALDAGTELYEVAAEPLPQELTPHELAVQYGIVTRAFDHLKSLKIGYGAQIEALIRSGKNVPGYTFSSGTGREKWTAPKEIVARMGDLFNVNLRKNEIVTPNQARGLGIDPKIVRTFSERSQSGSKLETFGSTEMSQLFQKGE